MSVLLYQLRHEATSKFAWSGRIAPQLPPPIAEPAVIARSDGKSLVFAAGALNDRATVDLASVVLQESRRADLVYVALALLGGRIGELRTAAEMLYEAGQQCRGVIAYLQECCFGPGLWLASQCGLIFSHPCTQIGAFECFDDAGEYDSNATLAMVLDLAAFHPAVSQEQFARLTHNHVLAEQAEAAGMVALCRDVFDLSGIDPHRPGATNA
jgi:hypothetical protein